MPRIVKPKTENLNPDRAPAEVMVGKVKFTLLNPEKAKSAMDHMEEKEMKMTSENLLAMYDRLGGAVRLQTELGARALVLGAFYDFENKVAKADLDYANLGDENLADEVVVVRKVSKKKVRKDGVADRLNKLEKPEKPAGKKGAGKKEEKEEGETGSEE